MESKNLLVEMIVDEINKSNLNEFVKRLLIVAMEDISVVDEKKNHINTMLEKVRGNGN